MVRQKEIEFVFEVKDSITAMSDERELTAENAVCIY